MTEQQRPPTEDELRAAYEAELKRVRVDDVLVQTIVSLINLGGLRAGLAPGGAEDRDIEQLRQAIDAIRALLPLVEPRLGRDAAAIRDALARLQLEYARLSAEPAAQAAQAGDEGEPSPEREPAGAPGQAAPSQPTSGEPGPAQRSGRLWVPGQ